VERPTVALRFRLNDPCKNASAHVWPLLHACAGHFKIHLTHSSYIIQPAIAESGGGSKELIPILYPASPQSSCDLRLRRRFFLITFTINRVQTMLALETMFVRTLDGVGKLLKSKAPCSFLDANGTDLLL